MAIELSRIEEFALIRINRPEALNALSFSLIAALGEKIDEAASMAVRGLLITGAGDRAFCAGAEVAAEIARLGELGIEPIDEVSATAHVSYILELFWVGAANLAAVAYGGWLVIQGDITIGTLIAFLGYVGGLFGPVQGLSVIYTTMRKGSVALQSIQEIINAQETLGDAPDAIDLVDARGDVTFENVHFAFGERVILRGITLEAKSGEVVALVGPSGGGKSTLMSLLQRFYDPNEGRILVDGIDIRTVKQKSLRQNMGVVLQEALLFDDTVANNIAYGRPEASVEAIMAAAKAAHADEFIRQLPGGYDASVGERGTRLSVGERHRVAIARALLKNPPILILDEATSSLDSLTEETITDTIRSISARREQITILIAHRLSTILHADEIMVLEKGSITETGTHDTLVQNKGLYYAMWRQQIGEHREVTIAKAKKLSAMDDARKCFGKRHKKTSGGYGGFF